MSERPITEYDTSVTLGPAGAPWDKLNPEWRRFGPAFGKKCKNPDVAICTRSACQEADGCQWRRPG